MRWSYKTVHYELKKDGLLGSAFLDESEIETSLNNYGKAGWELVSLLETLDGVTAVFKQPLSLESTDGFMGEAARPYPENKVRPVQAEPAEVTVLEAADPVDVDLSEPDDQGERIGDLIKTRVVPSVPKPGNERQAFKEPVIRQEAKEKTPVRSKEQMDVGQIRIR